MTERIGTLLKERNTAALIDELKRDPTQLDSKDAQGVSLLMLSFYYRLPELSHYMLQHKTEINLYEASASGNADAVKKHLQANPTLLNAYSADGFTALGFACFFNQPAVASLLLTAGADPNIASNNAFHVAPLHSAAAAHSNAIVTLLLEHQANPNVRQQGGVTPLHEAAHHGELEMTTLLLKYGADAKAKSDDGKTPYDMALEKGHDNIAALLQY
ncbi:ankyrin repeat domain-containing protein [Chryseolinea lacunae]|uniref:Ankyrin repeat domain-containing protein n=1 Tax=Chryseolinea lacunae TaxID=2801331 RepID=A0ABS1KWK1_9BACT|nr:ankyrin repeat domain-containing protein [Chryseolinea lacunae]MBL0743846.1 ankyrin repeat domain-containing protein [Chryseolinea lacunae]